MLNVLTFYTATGVLCPNYSSRVHTYTDTNKGILCVAEEYFGCFSLVYNAVPRDS
jgi:hypothetical protein